MHPQAAAHGDPVFMRPAPIKKKSSSANEEDLDDDDINEYQNSSPAIND
jgi:hypothetical protein